MLDILKYKFRILLEFWDDSYMSPETLTDAIGSYKEYTTKGKSVFILLCLLSVIFYTGAVVALTIFSVYIVIVTLIWEIIKLVYLPFKPLTSRIPWGKLSFKIKK